VLNSRLWRKLNKADGSDSSEYLTLPCFQRIAMMILVPWSAAHEQPWACEIKVISHAVAEPALKYRRFYLVSWRCYRLTEQWEHYHVIAVCLRVEGVAGLCPS